MALVIPDVLAGARPLRLPRVGEAHGCAARGARDLPRPGHRRGGVRFRETRARLACSLALNSQGGEMSKNRVIVALSVLTIAGCATAGKRTAIGAGGGAAAGAGVGAVLGGWKGAAIGAAIGGVAGGSVGLYLDKQ